MKIINKKNIKINLILLFIPFLNLSCKESENFSDINLKNESFKDTIDLVDTIKSINIKNDTVHIRKIKIEDLNGKWYAYKFLEDSRFNDPKFNKKYAEEYSKYASFEIKENKFLLLNSCNNNLYVYKYPVKTKKYEDENIFTTFFKPKLDSLSFVSSIDGIQTCEKPYKTFCVYENSLVIHDRGYFFFFTKNKDSQKNTDLKIEGIPSDSRISWNVSKMYNTKSITEAYQNFKKDFTYGGLNLIEQLPHENFIDKESNIEYEIKNQNILISKSDPLGVITILLQKKGNMVQLTYKMEYPDEG